MTGQPRAYALLAALVIGLALVGSATSTWAHPPAVASVDAVDPVSVAGAALPAPMAAPTPAIPTAAPLAPMVLLTAALGVALTARRRALATALALVTIVLAAETGVHSVHHLTDQQAATECVVALASANVHGTAGSPSAADAVRVAVPIGAVVAPAPQRPGARPSRPDEGRAPPAA